MNRGQMSRHLEALTGQVGKREFRYEPEEEKRVDWNAYDMSQVRERACRSLHRGRRYNLKRLCCLGYLFGIEPNFSIQLG